MGKIMLISDFRKKEIEWKNCDIEREVVRYSEKLWETVRYSDQQWKKNGKQYESEKLWDVVGNSNKLWVRVLWESGK